MLGTNILAHFFRILAHDCLGCTTRLPYREGWDLCIAPPGVTIDELYDLVHPTGMNAS